MLMNQMKMKNPQMFNKIESLRNSNGNPMDLFKQVTSKFTPEQMNQFYSNAKQFGIPDDVIQQAQNGINTK